MAYPQYYEKARTVQVGSLTLSGANTVAWQPGEPVDIRRVVFVVTTAASGSNATLTIGSRKADGSNAVQHSQFVFATASGAVNSVHYYVVGEATDTGTTAVDGSTTYAAAPGLLEIDPGEEVYISSNGAPTAGVVDVYIDYIPQPFTGSRVGGAVKMARV